jgi:23S rRNA (cytosine1962-C5)-methyltransferase
MSGHNAVDIILKTGREKSVLQRHPWLFSGAIARVDGNPSPGETVRLLDFRKNFLAYGYYNQVSQIAVRVLEWDESNLVDDSWWESKIAASIGRREKLANDKNTDSYRLIFSESDFLPGLVVDKYSDYLSTQFLTAGADALKPVIISALNALLKPVGIYERSDAEIRLLEGLPSANGLLIGKNPPDKFEISENSIRYLIDIAGGHKTGHYLDQRENRLKIRHYSAGLDILDCFCYTGGFSINALTGGANSVTLVDSSKAALNMAQANIELNGLPGDKARFVESDVFDFLRESAKSGKLYDMVILDPPKFASSKAHLKKALSAYKDINMYALKVLKPGGILVSYSCSGIVSAEALKVALFWASIDADKPVQIIEKLCQTLDHPILLSFPESEYLKGYICKVL